MRPHLNKLAHLELTPPRSPSHSPPDPLQLSALPSPALLPTLLPCTISSYFPTFSPVQLFLRPPSPSICPISQFLHFSELRDFAANPLEAVRPPWISPDTVKYTEHVGSLTYLQVISTGRSRRSSSLADWVLNACRFAVSGLYFNWDDVFLGHQNLQIVEVINKETYCHHCSGVVSWLDVWFCFGFQKSLESIKIYQRGKPLGQAFGCRLQQKIRRIKF